MEEEEEEEKEHWKPCAQIFLKINKKCFSAHPRHCHCFDEPFSRIKNYFYLFGSILQSTCV
jgi:hypothetical protein